MEVRRFSHIIVNPFHKLVGQVLRVAIEQDGQLRRKIANAKTKETRDRCRAELIEQLSQQKALKSERDAAPTYVLLRDSKLDGRLEYMALIIAPATLTTPNHITKESHREMESDICTFKTQDSKLRTQDSSVGRRTTEAASGIVVP